LVSIGGLMVARNWLAHSSIKTQHDITDPYSQFVAMLFAVLLGFMVADSMQRFSEARQTVQTEASSLGDVFRISEGFTEGECKKIRTLCLEYAKDVSNVEWELLAHKQDSATARSIYRNMWHECTTVEPSTQRQANAQQAILSAMQSLGAARR